MNGQVWCLRARLYKLNASIDDQGRKWCKRKREEIFRKIKEWQSPIDGEYIFFLGFW